MKTFWAVVIIAVGAYAVHEHNRVAAMIANNSPSGTADQARTQVGGFRGRWAVPTGKKTIPGLPKGLRYNVPAAGYPNQGGAYIPTGRGYVPPSGPKVNQNGGFTINY